MEFRQIEAKLKASLDLVIEKDVHLLKYKLHERSLVHRLAVYISPLFDDFDVDIEYDGNIDDARGKKRLWIPIDKARQLNLPNKKIFKFGLIAQPVYPDIIVHRRGKNGPGNNLLVIEIKKSSSRISYEWDYEKLCRFTSGDYGNKFNYKYGAFVQFSVGNQTPHYDVKWYQDGRQVTDEELNSSSAED